MSDGNRDLEGGGRFPFNRLSRCCSEETEGIKFSKSGNCTAIHYSIPHEIWYILRSRGSLLVHLWDLHMRVYFQLCIYLFTYLKFRSFPWVADGFTALLRCRNSDIKVILQWVSGSIKQTQCVQLVRAAKREIQVSPPGSCYNWIIWFYGAYWNLNLIEKCLLVSPSVLVFCFWGYDVLVLISLCNMLQYFFLILCRNDRAFWKLKLCNEQRNAQFFYLFIYVLLPYMFRTFF
jgi:hypothetical protein